MAVAVCARAGRPAVAGNPSKLVHRHILSPVKTCLCAASSCCRCATQTASRPLCSSAPTPTSRYARRPARLFCCRHAAVPLSSLRVSCPVTTQLVHVCHSLLHPSLVAAGEGGFHGWAQAGGHHLRCSLHRHLPAGGWPCAWGCLGAGREMLCAGLMAIGGAEALCCTHSLRSVAPPRAG